MRVSRAKSGASPDKPKEAFNLCAVLFKLSVRVYTAASLLSSLFIACICKCGRENTRQSIEQKTAAESFSVLYLYLWVVPRFGGLGCK